MVVDPRFGSRPGYGDDRARSIAQALALGPCTIAVLCSDEGPSPGLLHCVEQEGLEYRIEYAGSPEPAQDGQADLILLDLTDADQRRADGLAKAARSSQLPKICALSVDSLTVRVQCDDVVVAPWHPGELIVRVRRLVEKNAPTDAPGVIRAGDLVIDTNRYDVFLSGKPVVLTFKEYELLKLLASSAGRVYTREALLEQVWGYQYFGGTRTVDVHIRRLRSKIEDATHTFIDTVWNVGYRFKVQAP